jgi:hypothetical protein
MSVGRGVFFKKDTVDDCLRLDMMTLVREVDLGEPEYTTITWRSARGKVSNIGVYVEPPRRILLSYSVTDRQGKETDYAYYVWAETTACHFGGERWWFNCPECHRRCRILYKPYYANVFKCRLCYNLTYRSQQEGNPKAWALVRAVIELPELQRQLYQTRSAKERKRLLKKAARICGSVEWLEKEESES